MRILIIVTVLKIIFVSIKKLLNDKYCPIKATITEIFTFLTCDFKKTEISKQMNVSRMTIHRVEQLLSASETLKDRLQSGYQRGLRKRPMLETDKTVTEKENFSLHDIQDGQKMRGKSLRRSTETPVKYNNGSEEHPFVE